MLYHFMPMTATDARAILAWHYAPPYHVYDGNENLVEGDLRAEYLNPISPYFSVRTPDGDLIGFFVFGTGAEVLDDIPATLLRPDGTLTLGFGLRPDLTGQGQGVAFVQAGLDFANMQFHPTGFRLFVYPWNQRAIRVYTRSGFTANGTVTTSTSQDFLEMTRPAHI